VTSTGPGDRPHVVTFGTHVLDVLGRPVPDIPAGQASIRLEQIRATVAGTAAGVAVDLALLGARVTSIGAVGADALGDLLLTMMGARGIDVGNVVRLPDVQTSASILPIRPNGERPALHVVGANGAVRLGQLDLSPLAGASAIHLGGLDTMAGFTDADLHHLLQTARGHGLFITMDIQSGVQALRADPVMRLVPYIDVFLPNLEQAAALTGLSDPVAIARKLLAAGPGAVVLTMGESGSLYVSDTEQIHTPALEVDVVDTTGCGDAFCAGYLLSVLRGLSLPEALRRATAAATLVASGLGSDAGLTNWEGLEDFATGPQARPLPAPTAGSPTR
jgi:sugar/nucleoside kinase (ribokinase family)